MVFGHLDLKGRIDATLASSKGTPLDSARSLCEVAGILLAVVRVVFTVLYFLPSTAVQSFLVDKQISEQQVDAVERDLLEAIRRAQHEYDIASPQEREAAASWMYSNDSVTSASRDGFK
jgi:hypothetical protein